MKDTLLQSEVWLEGFAFPEAPRWHKGQCWFVDMYLGHIWCAKPDGKPQLVVDWNDYVSGLGWLPNGDLLFVAMNERAIMRHNKNGITRHADLSSLATSPCNDMITLSNGTSYVGTYGYDLHANASFQKGDIIKVTANGEASIAASGMAFPNGMALLSNGQQLIVAETAARRLTTFQLDQNGLELTNRHTWARIEKGLPDGISKGIGEHIWVAAIGNKREIVCLKKGGEVHETISTTQQPIACMIGGKNNQQLFITTVAAGPKDTPENLIQEKAGRVEVATLAKMVV